MIVQMEKNASIWKREISFYVYVNTKEFNYISLYQYIYLQVSTSIYTTNYL